LIDKPAGCYYYDASSQIRRLFPCRIALIILNFKEDIMIELTEAAAQQIAEYFKNREVAPIRIFLNEGG